MADALHPGYLVTPKTPNFLWLGADQLACPITGLHRVTPEFLDHLEALQELRTWYRGALKVVQGYAWVPDEAEGVDARMWHLIGPAQEDSRFATDVEPSLLAGMVPLRAPLGAVIELVAKKAESFGFTGIGLYPKWVHLDRRPGSLVVWDERKDRA